MQQNKFSNQKNKGEKRMTAFIYMLAIIFALGYATEREARRKAEKKIKKFYGEL